MTYAGDLRAHYTNDQHLCCDNSAMTLQNGFETHFQASPLILMRTEPLASSQSGRSVDADAWCKRGLTRLQWRIQDFPSGGTLGVKRTARCTKYSARCRNEWRHFQRVTKLYSQTLEAVFSQSSYDSSQFFSVNIPVLHCSELETIINVN